MNNPIDCHKKLEAVHQSTCSIEQVSMDWTGYVVEIMLKLTCMPNNLSKMNLGLVKIPNIIRKTITCTLVLRSYSSNYVGQDKCCLKVNKIQMVGRRNILQLIFLPEIMAASSSRRKIPERKNHHG